MRGWRWVDGGRLTPLPKAKNIDAMSDAPQSADPTSATNRPANLALALAIVLGVVLLVNWLGRSEVTRVQGGGQNTATDAKLGVTMTTGEGDLGLPTLVVPYNAGETVLDALQKAAERDGSWRFAYEGSGAKAFLIELGGRANEQGDGRYWQYEVNGQHAAVGIGAQRLEPGDRVLWKFAPYE